MARLSALLQYVHDEFPAVPEALALRALADATKEFCSRSHAWQEVLPQVRVRADERMYELSLDSGVQLVALKDVRLDGARIHPVALELYRLRSHDLGRGEPLGYVQWQPSTIELINPPSEATRLDVTAALTLKMGAGNTAVPDDLVDEYGEVLASGAKARLVRQFGQPWFLPDMAVGYAGPFYAAINTAKGRVMTALGDAQMQVEMRRW